MLLTLENIQNQQFNQRFRGYDMAEVDAFLDKIAESYLFLSTENSKIKEELDAIKKERNQSIDEEQSFKNAIISAQSFADDIKNKAESQATRLKEDAKEKSTMILEDAQGKANTLQDQISMLAGEKERIREELRAFLSNYLSQVDANPIATPPTNPAAEVVSMDQVSEFMAEPDDSEPMETEEEEEILEELELETPIHDDEDDPDSNTEDVAILYEKIDLDEDFNPTESLELDPNDPVELDTSVPPAAMAMDTEVPDFSTSELDDLAELDMPDLEGDMLYSLDDPLDNQEPAVVIDPLDDDELK